MDERSRQINSSIRYPFEKLPGEKFDFYAGACLETALSHSDYARALFSEVVRCWGLPDCKLIIHEFATHTPGVRSWRENVANVSPYNFIESYGLGAIRLSTHPALVMYDKQKLVGHHNPKIKKIAELLP
jgi:hypothetical protein